MNKRKFKKIANSNNPFIETCFGLTRLFTQQLNRDNARESFWIEFINKYGFTTTKNVGMWELDEYCK